MISVDFGNATQQADALAQTALGMGAQSDRLDLIVEELGNAWKGDAAEAYLKELENYNRQMKADAKRCKDAANDFRTLINELKELENEALRIIDNGIGEGISQPGNNMN